MTPLFALFVTSERKAAAELSEAGFEVWAPTYKRLRRAHEWQLRQRGNQGERKALRPAALIDTPIFPGYVFARIGPERFSHARLCEHVVRPLTGSDGFPRPVPEDAFTDMIILVMSGRLDERAPGTKALPRGTRRRGLASLNEWFAAAGNAMRKAA